MKTANWRSWVLDAAILFLFTAVLIGPLYRLKYLDNWASIESTFIADARMLSHHWNQTGWQPLWYCGTRIDYIYPPALRFGTALIGLYPRISMAKAYHIYTAFFYCIGIAGVYVLARSLLNDRRVALWCAAGAALISPAYLVMARIRYDVAGTHYLPMRLNVLVRYGEGPHIAAVAILPLALAAAWVALSGRRRFVTVAAAVLSALVVSNNFYGATALAIFFLILCWARWVTMRDWKVLLRASIIAILSYGLTAFWLTPSYVGITLSNMSLVSQPGHLWSVLVLLAVLVLYVSASWWLARGRPERGPAVFLVGSFVLYTLNVIGNYYWDFRVIGEPHRLVPEWDMVTLLCVAGMVSLLRPRPLRIAGMCLLGILLAGGLPYLRHAWTIYPAAPAPEERVEYRIPAWLAKNLPDSRVYAAGSIRFWFNAWHDTAQIGGGSEQGVLNRRVVDASWDFVMAPKPESGVLWLQALGADGIVVMDKTSQEVYHDYQFPKRFDGVLPVVYDDFAGNRIYRAPRRFPTRARVVDRAQMTAMAAVTNGDLLRAYVELIEHGPDAEVTMKRPEPELVTMHATVAEGQAVLFQESYDPNWRAEVDGRGVGTRKDPMGFLLVDVPPGVHDVRLQFETPFENQAGRLILLVTLVAVGWILKRH
ncbi:MAG: hypothetical protein ABI693_25720 [Bryobacteraceae bacterium]